MVKGIACISSKQFLLFRNVSIRLLSVVASPSFSHELYDLAICKLNRLADTGFQKSDLNRIDDDPDRNIKATRSLLERMGVTDDDIQKLKVIHISGSQDKALTCVITEQLLKSLGLTTGVYSSPHLFKVNERIRINGVPISDDVFARYFWNTYWPSIKRHAHEFDYDPPEYYNILTAMAYHMFLEKQVDVAIMATGFGGRYDATNLLTETKTVGITPLLMDHSNQMGNTIADVAWHNSGIIKHKSNVFTIRQPPECMEVIDNVVQKYKAKLQIVPKYEDYKWESLINFKIGNNIQKSNATQAIQLAYNWIRSYKANIPSKILNKVDFLFTDPKPCPIDLPKEFIKPLQSSNRLGSYHIVYLRNKTVYLDAGQNWESIKSSINWVQSCTRENRKPKCLLFSGSDDQEFYKPLKLFFDHLSLDLVYFTPSCANADNILNCNSRYSKGEYEGQMSKCHNLRQIWSKLQYKSPNFNDAKVVFMPSISSCFEKLNEIYKNGPIDIFVIGSLQLVGETLQYLNQNKGKRLGASHNN